MQTAVSLVAGYMEVSFEKRGSGRSSDVALGGTVQLEGLPSVPSIEAGVHLYKTSTGSNDLQWTVYGSFTALGNTTTLGELFSELKGSFLQDFALQDLMFVAASSDDPVLSHMNPQKYPIRKGECSFRTMLRLACLFIYVCYGRGPIFCTAWRGRPSQ